MRYSAAAFKAKGLDTPGAATLAAELAQVVAGIVDNALRPVVERVVEDLNAMGHSLQRSGPDTIGEVNYRDEWTDAKGYHARLRLAVDIVVSTGNAHNLRGEDVLAELRSRTKQGHSN